MSNPGGKVSLGLLLACMVFLSIAMAAPVANPVFEWTMDNAYVAGSVCIPKGGIDV